MSSNSASSQQLSKGSLVSGQPTSAPQFQNSGVTFTADSAQRRPGGAGSFGAAQIARNIAASNRNNQSLKKQHKGGRRPRLADEDAYAESAAMTSTTSRKGQTSITHLMNFALPPRPRNQPSSYSHRAPRRPQWGLGSGYHAADKARYVHANYRFIVDPNGDYRAQAVDADVHLDWTNVLQVLASAQTQSASCPICLSTPTAPRMAKCGHMFCLPCLIRYMHSTDDEEKQQQQQQPRKTRRKSCPICEDTIFMSETRPVRWFVGQEVDSAMRGGDILLRLVTRRPGSTLALPRDGAEILNSIEDIPWYHVAEVADYARVMKGGEEYMLEQYTQEIEELQRQGQEDELIFGEDMTWTRKAINNITEAKEKVAGIGNPPPTTRYLSKTDGIEGSSKQAVKAALDAEPQPANTDKVDGLSSELADLQVEASSASTTLHQPRGHQPRAPDHPFYFYQALPHYYLSPLDIRILKSAFTDFSLFPSTILPRIEHISTGHIVDDDLRKRAKYLAHLPHGCEVSFLECDWTDFVSRDVFSHFSTELDRRRRKNREKENREDKDRLRAERLEEEQRWAALRRKRPSLNEKSFSEQDFLPLGMENIPTDGSSDFASTSPPWATTRSKSQSFATLASPGTSPTAPRTVWGTAAVPGASPILTAQQNRDDGWLQGWEEDLLDRDIVAQIQAVEGFDADGGVGSSKAAASSASKGAAGGGGGGGGGGKKKNKKKITLMSTNARRQA